MRQFTKEQMQRARKTDLYDYLTNNHMDIHKREGQSLRPVENHSLSIKKGYCGYLDFSDGEHGNAVDYLTRYLGYQIDDAVFALIGESDVQEEQQEQEEQQMNIDTGKILFPAPVNGKYRQLFAHLISRGIPADVIQRLIHSGLIYQSRDYNNIVFLNYERDWAELRGTYTYTEEPFHGIVANSRRDGFWWFRTSEDAQICYICEGGIDAISLYLLHRGMNNCKNAYYISIGGAAKQQTINRIKHQKTVILAVDNDTAGEECRNRNSDLDAIIPYNKDWNEDLVAYKRNRAKCF